jgi:hypothetical protein
MSAPILIEPTCSTTRFCRIAILAAFWLFHHRTPQGDAPISAALVEADVKDLLIVLLIAFGVAYAADVYFYDGAYSGEFFDSLSTMITSIRQHFR